MKYVYRHKNAIMYIQYNLKGVEKLMAHGGAVG
jgi:hypothetical protein